MASDVESRKRAAVTMTASADEVYKNISCSVCAQLFDEADRTPRVLHCGHHFCTACLRARIRHQSARKWSIACPVDGEETPVPRGDESQLSKNFALISMMSMINSSLDGLLPFRIFIKNLAGDTWPLVVRPDDTIAHLKRRVQDLHFNFVEHLQKLMYSGAGGEFVVLEDARTLASYGIVDCDAVVSVLVVDGFRGGAHLQTFGSMGRGTGQLKSPNGICASTDGELLFVADTENNRVMVLRASDGSHVRLIETGFRSSPIGICISGDDELLFVVTDGAICRICVFRASSGSLFRTIEGHWYPWGICSSLNGEFLFVISDATDCVHVLRTSDGKHMRTIGGRGTGTPRGICLSSDGASLFVADCNSLNYRVQVFRAAGGRCMYSFCIRDVGTQNCAGKHCSPHSVCLSPNGEWLFVSDARNHRVLVLRAVDGALVHTIGSKGIDYGQFNEPTALCMSPSGDRLFVTDNQNHRVQVFAIDIGL